MPRSPTEIAETIKYSLIVEVAKNECIPFEWIDGKIVKLPKKETS